MDRKKAEETLLFRHACKRFDPDRKIPREDLRFILEAGRMAPSSFGMEPWSFRVIRSPRSKSKLRPVCWDQPQITECSDLVVILARIADPLRPSYYRSMFRRRNLPPEATEAYIRRYREYIDGLHSVSGWALRQCYIAASHMMIYAACIGVDSCPIEGFDRQEAEKALALDLSEERLALLLPLGFRKKDPPPKQRRPFDEVVVFEK